MKYFIKPLKQYFDFKTRASRKEYWMFFLFNTIISFALAYFAQEYKYSVMPLIYLAYLALFIIPSVAIGVRRMHDVGKSGWFLLVPIYNLVLVVTKGQIDDNQYGQNLIIEK